MTSLMSPLKQKIINEIVKLIEECLTCSKSLQKKDVLRGKFRCKKCDREYRDIWPAGHKEFLDMFGKKNV